ncbi:MAG: triose-phosphate isomerase [Chloroflexi bacterium]|nr:triose-phosphate isomerase [Chloroflexota bacterium]
MPLPLIVGNWKMHTSVEEAVGLAKELRASLDGVQGVEMVVCPPFVSLVPVKQTLDGSPIRLGAQNMHDEEKGAFTGEVSPAMLAPLCEFVILGHSERRQHFGEADGLINRKVKAAMRFGLRPILCVGETLAQRQAGQAEEVVGRQLRESLAGIDDCDGLVVAYEPVWAIGTGVPATPETAQAMMGGILFATLALLFGEHSALETPLLYGGSVTAASIQGFIQQPAVHGALVGGASLRASEFAQIVRIAARVKGE